MPYLIAQGKQLQHRWRRLIPEQGTVTIGRTTPRWNVPWDPQISRQHANIKLEGDSISVVRHLDASNPIFYQGAESEEFQLSYCQHFVIGETMFTLEPSRLAATLASQPPVAEQTIMLSDLHKLPFEETSQRIELLSQLPQIISSATDEQELLADLTGWLFKGISRATGIALVRRTAEQREAIEIMHWDYRGQKDTYFSPSQNLIEQAIESQLSTIHFWDQGTQSEYTELQGIDWAFCIPIQGATCQNWGLYVAGQSDSHFPSGDDSLTQYQVKQDLKYAELASSTLSNLRMLKNLERSQAHFRQYFPDVVVEALSNGSAAELLAPRETDLSVMFCDLTGFTQASEGSREDLMKLLHQTSESLSLITQQILAHDGVIGDFHGDAVMGFWGWPVATSPDVHASNACSAAIDILADLNKQPHFSAKVGIASGRSVAGEIGSDDQVKVSVLGPVVNLASRLESMNRQFGTTILVDQATAEQLNSEPAGFKLIRLGRVRPYGMEGVVEIFTLMRHAEAATIDTSLKSYAVALEAIDRGDLEQAHRLVSEITATGSSLLRFANVLLGHVELHLTLANKTNTGLQKSEPHIMHLAMK